MQCPSPLCMAAILYKVQILKGTPLCHAPVKSCLKPVYRYISRDQSYRLPYLFWQKMIFTLQIGDQFFLILNTVYICKMQLVRRKLSLNQLPSAEIQNIYVMETESQIRPTCSIFELKEPMYRTSDEPEVKLSLLRRKYSFKTKISVVSLNLCWDHWIKIQNKNTAHFLLRTLAGKICTAEPQKTPLPLTVIN